MFLYVGFVSFLNWITNSEYFEWNCKKFCIKFETWRYQVWLFKVKVKVFNVLLFIFWIILWIMNIWSEIARIFVSSFEILKFEVWLQKVKVEGFDVLMCVCVAGVDKREPDSEENKIVELVRYIESNAKKWLCV